MRLEVEEINVTGNTSGRVALAYTPSSPMDVLVDPIGGPAQVLGTDFVVDGKYLNWDLPSSDIKKVVALGIPVILRVAYERAT